MAARRTPLEVAKARAETAQFNLKTFRAKRALEVEKRAYDAATPNANFPQRGDARSADAVTTHAGDKLRKWARYLDENLDIATGALDTIVDHIIGTGILIIPTVEKAGGEFAVELNRQILRRFTKWTETEMETTGELSWGDIQRKIVRSTKRDGEMLINHLTGPGAFDHRSDTPYTLELIEADQLPFELNSGSKIVHGVEKNEAQRAIAYHLLENHPGDSFIGKMPSRRTIRVPAEQITHVKFCRRIGQTRGVSVFHSVLQRLEDIKDYEESERIAARVTANFSAYIRKANDDTTNYSSDSAGNRTMELSSGMIFDDLLPGEEIGSIGMDRPNSQLEPHRNGQLRAAAAGLGMTFSALAKRYDGTYSAQRQELVEQKPADDTSRDYFIATVHKRIYKTWLQMEILSGGLAIGGIDEATLFDAEYIPPAMPWIDPAKEAAADKIAVDEGFKSRHQIIRERGGDPEKVDRQMDDDNFEPARQAAPGGNDQNEQSEAN